MTWHEVSLKQICDVDWGNTKLTKSSYVAGGKFLAVSASGADGLIDHYEHEANVPVLSAIGAQCGRMFYPGERFTAIKNTITLTPKVEMADGKFLYYLFTSVELPQRGAGQPFISKGDIEAFRVLIPESLEEQRQIVEKLDSAFLEIDLLEKNIKLGDEMIDQLLQSILSAEFKSNIDDWVVSHPTAQQGNNMKLVPLKEFCKMYQPPTISTKEMIPDGDYVVYGANGPIGRYDKFNHEESQLLVTCRGATCGAVNMSEPFAWINGNAMVIQPDLKLATLEYIKYAFLGGIDVSSSITGSAQPQITRTTLEVIKVPLPSLEKQHEIVEKLNGAFAEIDLLRNQSKAKKEHASAMRDSLLSDALTQEKTVV